MTRNKAESVEPAQELAAQGLRATRQRVAVLEHLRRVTTHPTAGEIHQRLREEHPTLSLKTVYDVLESLVGAGLASSVTHGTGPHRYEGNASPHYHAKCVACGSLTDVPARADGHIRGRTPLPEGFDIEEIRVTILGRCPACQSEH